MEILWCIIIVNLYGRQIQCLKERGHYKLYIHGDGNLVAYGVSGAIWATGTDNKGTGPYEATLEKDCNFALYYSTKKNYGIVKHHHHHHHHHDLKFVPVPNLAAHDVVSLKNDIDNVI